MVKDPTTGTLAPFNFDLIRSQIPELNNFDFKIDAVSFDKIIDSSNIEPAFWKQLATVVYENYEAYDGFVVLHGTDTMAYSASALSFMLQGLSKPVVFTGSQLPLSTMRTDGRENLISAIEISAHQQNGVAVVPEVSIFFENKLFRGNRSTKYNAENFDAFRSNNYPPLAEAGVHIKYNKNYILDTKTTSNLVINTQFSNDLAILKLFPGISNDVIKSILDTPNLRAIVIETYGSGNAPNRIFLLDELKKAVLDGLIVLNVTQCHGGRVDMTQYETGMQLLGIGVLSGSDITIESATTKLMHLLGQKDLTVTDIKSMLNKSIMGEVTI